MKLIQCIAASLAFLIFATACDRDEVSADNSKAPVIHDGAVPDDLEWIRGMGLGGAGLLRG